MDKKEKKKEKLFKKQMPSEKNVKKENVQIWLYTGRHRKSYDGFL